MDGGAIARPAASPLKRSHANCGARRPFRIGDWWSAAVSIGVHAMIVGAMLWSMKEPNPAAAPVVEMSMPIAAIEETEAVRAPDLVTTTVKPPDVVQEHPVETARLTGVMPDDAPQVEPDAVTPATLPEAEPEIEVVETRAAEPPVVVPRPPRPRPMQQVAAAAPVAPPDPTPAPPALPVPPSPAPIENHVAEAASGATTAPSPDYLTRLRAWLEKHKQYPQQAQRRRQQGTALLRFTLARDGRLLAHSIERSSGFSSLDAAVEEMIERAAPLPPLPSEMTQDALEIVVPIAFFLR